MCDSKKNDLDPFFIKIKLGPFVTKNNLSLFFTANDQSTYKIFLNKSLSTNMDKTSKDVILQM